MKHTIFHIESFIVVLVAVAVAAVITACNHDSDEMLANGRVPLTFTATIEGELSSTATTTRAVKYPTHDWWSNYRFEVGDAIGFFSKTGGENNGPMVNVKLVAESVSTDDSGQTLGKFRAEDGTDIEASTLDAKNVHFYFPYDENITTTGLELRIKDEKDGITRCIDFLSDEKVYEEGLESGDLSGIFKHAFGELIITRGTGFDTPGANASDYTEEKKDFYEKITVVMRDPVTHVKINCTSNPWAYKTELTSNDEALNKCDNKDARRWRAWKGDLYGQTTDSKGKEAWYVIVPTLKGNPSIVEYIEIYDNDGKLQKVSVLRLDDKDDSNINRDHQDRDGNYVWASWRYPMEIAMKELVPTVNPYPIQPWDQTNNDITNKRAPGITNPTDFEDWITKYNTYLANDRKVEYEDQLKAYGDLEEEGEKKVWHFYISADFEFGSTGNTTNTTIDKLEDILDGQSATLEGYTFSNHTLTNVTKTFVNELKENGCLRNIDFKSPTVTVPAETQQAGIIANTIDKGTITNCNINSGGLIGNTDTTVGIVAGSITDGKVENCTLSGLIIGKESDEESGYMFGTQSGNPTLTNNNSTNVTFSDINQTDDES